MYNCTVLYSKMWKTSHVYIWHRDAFSIFFSRGPKNFASSQNNNILLGEEYKKCPGWFWRPQINSQSKQRHNFWWLGSIPPICSRNVRTMARSGQVCAAFFLPWGNLKKWRTLAAINFLKWDSCGICWQMEFMHSHKISSETKFIPMIPDSELVQKWIVLVPGTCMPSPAAFFFGGGGWLADKPKATALEPARWINIAIFGQGHDSQTPNKNWAPWQISDVLVSKGCHFFGNMVNIWWYSIWLYVNLM